MGGGVEDETTPYVVVSGAGGGTGGGVGGGVRATHVTSDFQLQIPKTVSNNVPAAQVSMSPLILPSLQK